MKEAVTLRDVAARAGVSQQTVSNALNAPHRLQRATFDKVVAAIENLGYRPNRSARSLRTASARLIGYCVARRADGVANPMMDEFLHALTTAAEGSGRHVLLFTAPPGKPGMSVYADLIAQRAVDAFVLSDTASHDPRHRWLTKHGARLASFGRVWQEPTLGGWVDVDGAAGCADAVRHLHSLGHRRVAFLSLPSDGGAIDDRLNGWRTTCEELGMPAGENMVGRSASDTVPEGVRRTQELLSQRLPPTAIVAASDIIAIGALRADATIAVTGFDDSPLAAAVSPGLTSVRQPIAEIATSLISLLDDDLSPTSGILLRPRLVIRPSSDPTTKEH